MKTATVLLLTVWAAAAAAAQDKPCQDPCVPEAQRQPARVAAPAGAALREQAVLKLKQRFDDADADRNGRLTLQEADAGGFGFVAKHFAQIDSKGQGAVSFDDLRRFLDARK
jgi:hypothetical protein